MTRKIRSDKYCYSMWRSLHVLMSVCDSAEQFGCTRYEWQEREIWACVIWACVRLCKTFNFRCQRCAHKNTNIVKNGKFHWKNKCIFYLSLCVIVRLYSQICILSCVCYLLWHVTPSAENLYPLWHAQYQEPSVLIHSCSQPPLSLSHSFLSVYRYRIHNITQSILFKYYKLY